MGLIQKARVNVASLVGGEFTLDKATEAYASLESQQKVAIVLSYPQTKQETISQISNVVSSPRSNPVSPFAGKVNIALVGPGSFAKDVLLPLLRRSTDYRLRWVVSSSPVNAEKVAARYKFQKYTCDYGEILKDPETNLVVISAPNNLHYPMVMRSLEAS